MGAQHRGRARRSARSRLCRLLRRRRLYLRPARRRSYGFRFLGWRCRSLASLPATLGIAAGLSRAAPQGRLPRHRDARASARSSASSWSTGTSLTGGPNGIAQHPASELLRHSPFTAQALARGRHDLRGPLRHSPIRRSSGSLGSISSSLCIDAGDAWPSRRTAAAAADRPGLGSASRGRDRVHRRSASTRRSSS